MRTPHATCAQMHRRSEALAQQLQEQSEQMAVLQAEILAHGGEAHAVVRLRSKLQRVEEQTAEQVDKLQRGLAKHKKEIVLLNTELSRSKREEVRRP